MNQTVIAVDPGRSKCGVAVVNSKNGVLYKSTVSATSLTETVRRLAAMHGIHTVVLGDRTESKSIQKDLAEITVLDRRLDIALVDEHRSTEEARKRYWIDNPPKGMWKLVPLTMQTPPVPVDDYVAVILAERYFRQRETTELTNNLKNKI